MRSELPQLLFCFFLLGGFACGPRPARSPRAQAGQRRCISLLDQGLLCFLVELLGIGQATNRGIQVPQEAFRVGIDLLALLVGEIQGLLLVGSRAEVRFARLRRGEVCLSDIPELRVEGGDVGILPGPAGD